MAQNWYYAEGKQKLGPINANELRELAAAGRVQPTTMVLKEGAQRWVQADSIQGLFAPSPSSDGPAPPTTHHQAAGGFKSILDDLLVSLGAPRLGEPWTSQQKTIAILVCVGLFPLVLSVVILYGMYRLLVLWFTRPKVVVRGQRSRSLLGSMVSAILQAPTGSGQGQGEPERNPSPASSGHTPLPSSPPTQVCGYGCVIVRVGTNTVTIREKCDRCGHVSSSSETFSKPSRNSRITGSFTCFQCGARQEKCVEGS